MPVRVRVSSSVLRHIHNYNLYVKTQQGSPWEDNYMIEEVVVYYFLTTTNLIDLITYLVDAETTLIISFKDMLLTREGSI
jgi:hypothetical protein